MFLVIVAAMVIAGIVMHFFGGAPALAVLVLLIGGYAVYSAYAIRQPSKGDQHIMHDGIEADATIVKVTDTGITLDGLSYVLKLHLRVEPKGAAPFDSSIEMPFQRGSGAPVGGHIRVKYDPTKPGHVVMVGDSISVGESPQMAPTQMAKIPNQAQIVDFMNQQGLSQAVESGQSLVYSTTMDPVAASTMLQTAEDQLQELRVSGVQTKALVVELQNLGISVNGNNQGVRIKLTVMPSDQDPYLAEAVGVISERSWPNYQVGQTLLVKVDPADRNRVSFWKSSADPG